MTEEMFSALLEIMEALIAKEDRASSIEETVRFNELRDEFTNKFIFGDT